MEGTKHIIECNCVLPQYRKLDNPVFHKFIVFSVIDDSGSVVPKTVQCENCGTIHKVYDLCYSEIIPGKDETRSVMTKNDIISSLPEQLVRTFEEYNLGIADYEAAKFYLENEKWGSMIVLSKEAEEEGYAGKALTFVSPGKFKIDPYFYRDSI